MHWLTIPYKEEDNCILLLYNKKYFPQKKISILLYSSISVKERKQEMSDKTKK